MSHCKSRMTISKPYATPQQYPLQYDRVLLVCMTDGFWICFCVGYAFARINQMSVMPNPIPCTLGCCMQPHITMLIQDLGNSKPIEGSFPFQPCKMHFAFHFHCTRLFTYSSTIKEVRANHDVTVRVSDTEWVNIQYVCMFMEVRDKEGGGIRPVGMRLVSTL